jgi:hypothetical protein
MPGGQATAVKVCKAVGAGIFPTPALRIRARIGESATTDAT